MLAHCWLHYCPDGMAVAKDLEEQILSLGMEAFIIRQLITDNAGACARARRILALRFPDMVFLPCWAHQVRVRDHICFACILLFVLVLYFFHICPAM